MARSFILAIAAITALVLTACGGDDADRGYDRPSLHVIDVHAEDVRFVPDALTVERGVEVELTLVNLDPVEHDFQIDEITAEVISGDAGHGGHDGDGAVDGDGALALHTKAGEAKSVTFRPLEAGEYEFYCTIPGHREAGMAGMLTVE